MLIHWLWYALLPGMNEREKVDLLWHFRDAEDIFFADKATLEQIENLTKEGIEVLEDKNLTRAEEVLQMCEDKDISILTYADDAYPVALKNIADPPLVLYYQGQLPDFEEVPFIGVVGTRKASAYGLSMAKRMGFQISRCGGTVVSGVASGIDAMAMKGALLAGGTVIGVLGCGIDVVYPNSSKELYADTRYSGCLISEFPPETPPMKWNFPKRNRIISGISRGVLVVEAPKGSGALITARHAREQGRDVFVVTGNAGVDTCAGSNDLLRSGAIFADCGWDVVGEYEKLFPGKIHKDDAPVQQVLQQDELEKPMAKVAQKVDTPRKKPRVGKRKEKIVIDKEANSTYSDHEKKKVSLTANEQLIVDQLTEESLVDDVIAKTGLSAGVVLAALTLLEIKGVVTRLPGRRVRRKE